MSSKNINKIASEIANLKETREVYKKHFWIKSNSMDKEQQKTVKKLFMKIDRLRNHLTLWLKHLVTNKPSNYDSYMQLIQRGKLEVQNSFKQLDQVMQKQA